MGDLKDDPAAVTQKVAEVGRETFGHNALRRWQTIGSGNECGVLLVENAERRAVYNWRIVDDAVVFENEAKDLSEEAAEAEYLARIEEAVLGRRRCIE